MSDVKELVDQYAQEKAQLRQQMEYIGRLITEVVYLNMNEKQEIRIPGKEKKKAEKYGLQIKNLKTSTVLKLIERKEE